MPLRITVEHLSELQHLLRQLNQLSVTPEARRGYIKAARILYDRARALCPWGRTRKKGTHLRDAIFLGPGPEHHPNVLVGVNHRKAPHAHLVEYGTRRWRGKPFFRPAWMQTRTEVLRTVEAVLIALLPKRSS